MQPLPAEHYRLLRAWIEHIVYAYWTHGGYLNWDTGYGFKRWHAGRTWALAQQGLLAIAASPRFHNAPSSAAGRSTCSTAASRSTSGSPRRPPTAKGIAPSNLYDVDVAPLGPSIREMFAARMQANAARAVALGLGSMQAPEPPPLYSFDGDIGRLTITTPHYSTAVLAVNQRAFPYGGIELAGSTTATSASCRTWAAGPGRASGCSCATARRRRSPPRSVRARLHRSASRSAC